MKTAGSLGPGAAALAAVVATVGAAAPVKAQLLRESSSGVGGALSVKAGPSLPAVANLTEQGGSPYWNAVYGGGSPAVLVALGVELQFLRSDAGTLALGASAGFLGFDGQLGEAETAPSARFNIVPVQLGLGYRFDGFVDRSPVPIAPYARAGLSWNLWWSDVGGERGVLRTPDGEESASGVRPGLFAAAGLAIALDALERSSAAQLSMATGIRTTYLFFEGQAAWVDGFGDGGDLDFSEITWFGGLMLEL